jgi:flagellar biosynthesis protein FlhF
LRLKSYHTATVESAIRLAHIELGDQAVFLGARRNDVGSDPGQAYEVSFAVVEGEQDEPQATPEAAARPSHSPASAPPAPTVGTGGGARRARRAEGPIRGEVAAADSGAFVSWKKFLRQINTTADPAAPAAARDTASQAAPAASADAEPKTGVPGRKLSPHNGSGALPHWREFVPGELAGKPAPVLFSDSVPPAAALPPAPAQAAPPARAPAAAANGAPAAASPPRNGAAAYGASNQQATGKRPATTPRDEKAVPVYSLEMLGQEVAELRRRFEGQQQGPAPRRQPAGELLGDPRLGPFYRRLSDNAVEPSLAAELVAGLRQAADQGAEAGRLAALLAQQIRGRFRTDSGLGQSGAPRTVAALVGPSGAGKTTAVAKLAFRCGLLRRRRVRLFSVDQLRIGAVEPLQAYAELMNTPLEVVDEFDRLSPALQAVREGEAQELLLIDTPGYGRREWERARRMAAALHAVGCIDVHLVIDLRTRTEDLRRAVEQFQVFRPAKLLFTRLDETATFGTMLNETVRTGLPVSFVSVGQRVPEDIVPAGEPELLRLLLRDRASH